MRRKMLVTLEVEVSDLGPKAREQCHQDMDGGDDLPTLADYIADPHGLEEIARALDERHEGRTPEDFDDRFEGSDTFVTFTDVRVTGYEWKDEPYFVEGDGDEPEAVDE